MTEKSIGTIVAEKIFDFAKKSQKLDILDEIALHGLAEKDGSAIVALEWEGKENLLSDAAIFFSNIRDLIISLKKEAVEQQEPKPNRFGSYEDGFWYRINYRFRIWPEDGLYEDFRKELLNK